MKSTTIGVLIALCACAVSAGIFDGVKDWWDRTTACNQENESCRFKRCCDEPKMLYCIRDELALATIHKAGTCLGCQSENARCNVNEHCCEGLQCDKEERSQPVGKCLPPRDPGQVCLSNTHCKSGVCEKEPGWFKTQGICQ